MKVIHYGSKRLIKPIFKSVTNSSYRNKPMGGLWTSPINSNYGWKDWCKESEFRECTIDNSFTLDISNAKILTINTIEDLLKEIDINKKNDIEEILIDYELISESYDVIHLTIEGLKNTRFSNFNLKSISLYGWDVETTLLLNIDFLNK